MTSQGSAHGRFARAIERRHLANAMEAARELGWLSLDDALAYCELVAEAAPGRFERAAVRWHGRLELETSSLTLADAQAALALLELLPSEIEARRLLRRLLMRAGPAPWPGTRPSPRGLM